MDERIKAALDAIPRLRGKKLAVAPLEGGLTNRNYSVTCGRSRYALRLAGASSEQLGIDRATECACAQAAARAGAGPEVIAHVPEHDALLCRFVPGGTLSPEDVRSPATLPRVVAALRRCHDSPGGGGRFNAFNTVRSYHALARKFKVRFPRELSHALREMDRLEAGIAPPERLRPCHNDLLPANFILHRGKVFILDWEYAGEGDVFFDLANLAANSLFTPEDEHRLLEIYFGGARPADAARLRQMRRVSDLREALWGFLQCGISTLDFDYRSYAAQYLHRFLEAR